VRLSARTTLAARTAGACSGPVLDCGHAAGETVSANPAQQIHMNLFF
jgi:hypothetical protein